MYREEEEQEQDYLCKYEEQICRNRTLVSYKIHTMPMPVTITTTATKKERERKRESEGER